MHRRNCAVQMCFYVMIGYLDMLSTYASETVRSVSSVQLGLLSQATNAKPGRLVKAPTQQCPQTCSPGCSPHSPSPASWSCRSDPSRRGCTLCRTAWRHESPSCTRSPRCPPCCSPGGRQRCRPPPRWPCRSGHERRASRDGRRGRYRLRGWSRRGKQRPRRCSLGG